MSCVASPYNEEVKVNRFVTIYDTTLRDGEQTPGVRFSVDDKVLIARKLDEFGIHEIEAGFPVVSEEERVAVKKVASERLKAKVLALCRALRNDVDVALSCDVDGVIIFIPLSDLHLKYKLKISYEQAVDCAVNAVEYAKEHGIFTQITAEDATRTDVERLIGLFKRAKEYGADRFGLADTVGAIAPSAFKKLVSFVKEQVKGTISVHCHNDLGLAVANSLAAYEAGADAISVSINGLGERCGNAALEEVVMALYCLYGVDLGFKLYMLKELSELVEKLSGVKVHICKPIVGENAFKHESGIHVAAVLKNPFTYECYSPELVGMHRQIVFGKHSGLSGIKEVLESRGLKLSDDKLHELLNAVKAYDERKGPLTVEQLIEMARGLLRGVNTR
ncbi:MAG: homoaconitate hydratase [Candidatus Methanomethylicota archaeon]|uniref:Homoaconitate hydratase n=1 Tax=Thermoproteota archaeon TaxID=2056631 RepID=A0A497F0T6_9CREN|nr:MAG: homoaconitate hydratase [Candidatus Verstraetearchaeota archaeon]RLE52919.1 MAG: homoaconitate hydratase [Candidatus Verstraetearchaeota archaeon]